MDDHPRCLITSPQRERTAFRSPYAARVRRLWDHFRTTIVNIFSAHVQLPQHHDAYLRLVDDAYVHDAYNSLSIEGYQVTPELIEKVLNHDWHPESRPSDAQERDALAARGYYEAFQRVRVSLQAVLEGKAPGRQVEQDLPLWYSSLWDPMRRLGMIEAHHTAGYRRGPVYIRGSRHVPPPREALLDAMDALFACLQSESHPAVRAVLGRYLFVYIHPYPDGNGRMARFLMNVMLASGGYPWTIIRFERRQTYFDALERVNTGDDIEPFTRFVSEEMSLSNRGG